MASLLATARVRLEALAKTNGQVEIQICLSTYQCFLAICLEPKDLSTVLIQATADGDHSSFAVPPPSSTVCMQVVFKVKTLNTCWMIRLRAKHGSLVLARPRIVRATHVEAAMSLWKGKGPLTRIDKDRTRT